MFTAATFQLIKNKSRADLESLLKNLSIALPDWSDDEFRVYERIDGELTEKICGLMKSPTIIDGYMNLLDLGGVTYTYSETDSELLGKIVANKDKILRGLENLPKTVEVDAPPKTSAHTEIKKEHVTLYKPLILGVALIGAGLFLLEIIGVVLIILGAISTFIGLKGKIVETPINEPQLVKQAPVRKEVKPPFTRNELQKTLDVLAQVNKIVRAI